MALIKEDRIAETSTSTGTGAMTLAGALTAHKAFSSVMTSPSDTCYYVIEGIDGSGAATGEWESGIGTYSAANTLTRTTVQRSSNANAAVTFSAGTKRVLMAATSALLASLGGAGNVSVNLPTMRPLSDFNQLNLTSTRSAVDTSGKGITLTETAADTTLRIPGLSRNFPSTTCRVAVFVQGNFGYGDFEAIQFGFSDGTKYDVLTLHFGGTGLERQTWSTSLARASNFTVLARNTPIVGVGYWLGLRIDAAGAKAYFEVSSDGVNFAILDTVPMASGYLGASGYTQAVVGLFVYNSTLGTPPSPASLTIRAWDEAGLSRTL